MEYQAIKVRFIMTDGVDLSRVMDAVHEKFAVEYVFDKTPTYILIEREGKRKEVEF